MCQGMVLCHTSRIDIYLIESSPAVKRISIFQFSFTLILIRQKFYKTLLFERKVFSFCFLVFRQKKKGWIPIFMGITFREAGMTETSNEIAMLSSRETPVRIIIAAA